MTWLWCAPALAGPYLERDFVLYADIIGGAASGGNGIALTPDGEPHPIDPHDFVTDRDLGVIVLYYDGARERDLLAADLERSLASDPSPLPWRLSSIEQILTLRDAFAIVTVRDEAAAIDWLSANRRAVSSTDQLSVLLVDRQGPAMAAIERW